MNPFNMKGSWGAFDAWFYTAIVARAMRGGYARFVEEGLPEIAGGATIVDVGCGPGDLPMLLAARYPRCLVIGLDSSDAMIRRARGRAQGHSNLRYGVADAMSLPLPDASVDVVSCLASIKHWSDPGLGLAEIRRALRPTGTLCLLEVDPECSTEAAARFVARWPGVSERTSHAVASYFRRFVASGGLTLARVVELCKQVGFAEPYVQRMDESLCIYVRATRT